MIVIVVVLGLAVLGLGGWVIWLRSHPRVIQGPRVEVPGPVREVRVPGPVQTREIQVPGPERIKEVRAVEYVRADDVPAAAIKGSQLADPRALPEPPGALPDSAVDGVRLGKLTARAGAARGMTGRSDADYRRQVAEISVLDMLVPPALLSVAASGSRGAQFGQVGAVQAARSLHTKLAARASELDDLWRQAAADDVKAQQRLENLLREVAGALTDPLAESARRRDVTVDAVATQLTAVLSRLGDTERRQHLAFGVGTGPVLVAGQTAGWQPVEDLAAHEGEYLPHSHKAAWAHRVETSPGDLLLLCTSSTARLIDRAGGQLRTDWSSPPSLVGFLHQLGRADGVLADDRAAVCLWEDAKDDEHAPG